MDSVKELIELLGKAKNFRLNIAAFLVCSFVLLLFRYNFLVLTDAVGTVLQAVCLITGIRIVYGLLGLGLDFFNNFQSERRRKKESEGQQEKLEQELIEAQQRERLKAAEALEKVASAFSRLDVFQLSVIQSLKKENHVTLQKGAVLFSLKGANIVRAAATGEKSESVALTPVADEYLKVEGWGRLDSLKLNAVTRLFGGMQEEELFQYKVFLKEDVFVTQYKVNSINRTYEAERFFNLYSKSVVFVQPQNGYRYTIDPVAKSALADLLK